MSSGPGVYNTQLKCCNRMCLSSALHPKIVLAGPNSHRQAETKQVTIIFQSISVVREHGLWFADGEDKNTFQWVKIMQTHSNALVYHLR